MNGSVTINGTRYPVTLADLTPADVLPVFRTDTSILKTDSILLHAAGAEQNSAKKVLIPHLVSMLTSSVAEDIVLTIEPYYDENNVYQGMYWHYHHCTWRMYLRTLRDDHPRNHSYNTQPTSSGKRAYQDNSCPL